MDVKVKTRLESKNEVIDRVGRFERKLQGAQQQSREDAEEDLQDRKVIFEVLLYLLYN